MSEKESVERSKGRYRYSGQWEGQSPLGNIFGVSEDVQRKQFLEQLFHGYESRPDARYKERLMQTDMTLTDKHSEEVSKTIKDTFDEYKEEEDDVEEELEYEEIPSHMQKKYEINYSEINMNLESSNLEIDVYHLLKERHVLVPIQHIKEQPLRVIVQPPFVGIYLGSDQIFPFDRRQHIKPQPKSSFSMPQEKFYFTLPQIRKEVGVAGIGGPRFPKTWLELVQPQTFKKTESSDENIKDYAEQGKRYNYLPTKPQILDPRYKSLVHKERLVMREPSATRELQKELIRCTRMDREFRLFGLLSPSASKSLGTLKDKPQSTEKETVTKRIQRWREFWKRPAEDVPATVVVESEEVIAASYPREKKVKEEDISTKKVIPQTEIGGSITPLDKSISDEIISVTEREKPRDDANVYYKRRESDYSPPDFAPPKTSIKDSQTPKRTDRFPSVSFFDQASKSPSFDFVYQEPPKYYSKPPKSIKDKKRGRGRRRYTRSFPILGKARSRAQPKDNQEKEKKKRDTFFKPGLLRKRTLGSLFRDAKSCESPSSPDYQDAPEVPQDQEDRPKSPLKKEPFTSKLKNFFTRKDKPKETLPKHYSESRSESQKSSFESVYDRQISKYTTKKTDDKKLKRCIGSPKKVETVFEMSSATLKNVISKEFQNEKIEICLEEDSSLLLDLRENLQTNSVEHLRPTLSEVLNLNGYVRLSASSPNLSLKITETDPPHIEGDQLIPYQVFVTYLSIDEFGSDSDSTTESESSDKTEKNVRMSTLNNGQKEKKSENDGVNPLRPAHYLFQKTHTKNFIGSAKKMEFISANDCVSQISLEELNKSAQHSRKTKSLHSLQSTKSNEDKHWLSLNDLSSQSSEELFSLKKFKIPESNTKDTKVDYIDNNSSNLQNDSFDSAPVHDTIRQQSIKSSSSESDSSYSKRIKVLTSAVERSIFSHSNRRNKLKSSTSNNYGPKIDYPLLPWQSKAPNNKNLFETTNKLSDSRAKFRNIRSELIVEPAKLIKKPLTPIKEEEGDFVEKNEVNLSFVKGKNAQLKGLNTFLEDFFYEASGLDDSETQINTKKLTETVKQMTETISCSVLPLFQNHSAVNKSHSLVNLDTVPYYFNSQSLSLVTKTTDKDCLEDNQLGTHDKTVYLTERLGILNKQIECLKMLQNHNDREVQPIASQDRVISQECYGEITPLCKRRRSLNALESMPMDVDKSGILSFQSLECSNFAVSLTWTNDAAGEDTQKPFVTSNALDEVWSYDLNSRPNTPETKSIISIIATENPQTRADRKLSPIISNENIQEEFSADEETNDLNKTSLQDKIAFEEFLLKCDLQTVRDSGKLPTAMELLNFFSKFLLSTRECGGIKQPVHRQ